MDTKDFSKTWMSQMLNLQTTLELWAKKMFMVSVVVIYEKQLEREQKCLKAHCANAWMASANAKLMLGNMI